MKDVKAPGVIPPEPLIVRIAPYMTTTITDRVDAAFSPPKNSPATCYSSQNQIPRATKKRTEL